MLEEVQLMLVPRSSFQRHIALSFLLLSLWSIQQIRSYYGKILEGDAPISVVFPRVYSVASVYNIPICHFYSFDGVSKSRK